MSLSLLYNALITKLSNQLIQHFITAPFDHNLYTYKHPLPTRARTHLLDLTERVGDLWQSSH